MGGWMLLRQGTHFMLCLQCISSIRGMLVPRSIKRSFTRSTLFMMPEGPEVRSLVDSISDSFSNRLEGSKWQLSDAKIISGRYSRAAPENWDEMITRLPAEIKQIKCKGKFIYFQCGDFYIFNTLGLSGGWSLSSSQSYTRASLVLKNVNSAKTVLQSKNLHFYDMIGYGTLKICLTKEELDKKLKSVGTCWIEEKPSFEEFLYKIKKTKPDRPLVLFLMDQSKLSGIGNYILSEGKNSVFGSSFSNTVLTCILYFIFTIATIVETTHYLLMHFDNVTILTISRI